MSLSWLSVTLHQNQTEVDYQSVSSRQIDQRKCLPQGLHIPFSHLAFCKPYPSSSAAGKNFLSSVLNLSYFKLPEANGKPLL